MTKSKHAQLRDEVLKVLEENGYSKSPVLQIGGISIEFDAAYVSPPDRLGIAVVAHLPESVEAGSALYWQIQRLARALESVNSRRSITVIVIGGLGDTRLLSDLRTAARVLVVDSSLPVQRLVAPLLDFQVPSMTGEAVSGLSQLRRSIRGRYSPALTGLLEAAPEGAKSVESAYLRWVDESFTEGSS